MINRQGEVQLSDYIPLCHVMVDGSISRRTNLLISSSVKVPGSILFIPSLCRKISFKKSNKQAILLQMVYLLWFSTPTFHKHLGKKQFRTKTIKKKAHRKVPVTKTESLLMEE